MNREQHGLLAPKNLFRVRYTNGDRGSAMVLTAVFISAILLLVFYCMEVYLLVTSRQQIQAFAELLAESSLRSYALSRDDTSFASMNDRILNAQNEGETYTRKNSNQIFRGILGYPSVVSGSWQWGRWRIEDGLFVPKVEEDSNAVSVTVEGEISSFILDKLLVAGGQNLKIKASATATHDEELMELDFYPHYVVSKVLPNNGGGNNGGGNNGGGNNGGGNNGGGNNGGGNNGGGNNGGGNNGGGCNK